MAQAARTHSARRTARTHSARRTARTHSARRTAHRARCAAHGARRTAHGAWRTAAGGRVRLARRAGGAGRGGGALACSPPEACRDVGSGQYGTTAQHIIKTSVHSRTLCGRRDGCVQRGRIYSLCNGTWAGDEQPMSRAQSGGGDGVRTRGAQGGGAGRGGGALAGLPPEAGRDGGSGEHGTTAQHIIKTSVH